MTEIKDSNDSLAYADNNKSPQQEIAEQPIDDIKEDDTTYDHVIKYTGVFGGVQGLNMLMNVARSMIVARILGPVGTAIIGKLSNFIELVHHTTDFGMCFSAIKHVSELFDTNDKERINQFICTVRTLFLLAGTLGTVVALICAIFITWTNPINIIVIAPMVGLITINAGEMAILKGVKQLKKVALASVFSTFATLIVTVPIYYIFGFGGIATGLLLNQVAILSITLHYSTKVYPYNLGEHLLSTFKSQQTNAKKLWETITSFIKGAVVTGKPMLVLGIGYVIAGVFGKGAEFIIYHFIPNQFSDPLVGDAQLGQYIAGYSIIVTYASYVFTAMEVDFFPRLSAASHDVKRYNVIVNQQIEVCALLMAPLLIGLVLFMPHMIHIIYSSRYSEAIPMAVCAALYMYFKAFSGPVEYLALAKGDSKMYMFVELAYDILIACLIPFAYSNFGLVGCGLALSATGLINFIFIFSIYTRKYHFKFSTRLIGFYTIQLVLIVCTIIGVMHNIETTSRMLKWTIGPVALLVSLAISGRILYKETTVIQSIKAKICQKFRS